MSEKIKDVGTKPGLPAQVNKEQDTALLDIARRADKNELYLNYLLPSNGRMVSEAIEFISQIQRDLTGGEALPLVLSVSDRMQQQLFGERIGAVSESDMWQFDDQIPEFAQRALRTARDQALASGATVLEAINGELVETSADGSRRFIKSLPAPYKVEAGAKRIRRAN